MFSFKEEETRGFSCLRDSRPISPYVGVSLIVEGSIRPSSTGLDTSKALEDIFGRCGFLDKILVRRRWLLTTLDTVFLESVAYIAECMLLSYRCPLLEEIWILQGTSRVFKIFPVDAVISIKFPHAGVSF